MSLLSIGSPPFSDRAGLPLPTIAPLGNGTYPASIEAGSNRTIPFIEGRIAGPVREFARWRDTRKSPHRKIRAGADFDASTKADAVATFLPRHREVTQHDRQPCGNPRVSCKIVDFASSICQGGRHVAHSVPGRPHRTGIGHIRL